MITKKIIIGLIQILENGVIQVREDTVLDEDGVELSRTYHRHVLDVGADLSNEDERVQAIANLLWTPEVIEARKIELEKIQDPLKPPVDPNSI